jgi:hypothetical protein
LILSVIPLVTIESIVMALTIGRILTSAVALPSQPFHFVTLQDFPIFCSKERLRS